jgi:hypothetical protein
LIIFYGNAAVFTLSNTPLPNKMPPTKLSGLPSLEPQIVRHWFSLVHGIALAGLKLRGKVIVVVGGMNVLVCRIHAVGIVPLPKFWFVQPERLD